MQTLRSPSMADTDQRLQEAMQSLQAGDTSRAEAIAKLVLRSQPKHESAWLLLARAQRMQGLNKLAMQSCKDALKAMPRSVGLLLELAMSQKASGRTAEAERSYRDVLAIESGHVVAMHNLANVLQTKNALDEALSLYKRALTLAPKLAQAHYEMGNVLAAKGDAAGARQSWQDALLIQPSLSAAWFSLGKQLQNEHVHAAIHALQKGLNAEPNHADSLALLSKLLSHVGRTTEGEQCARMAIGMAPNLALAHYALGLAWRIQGRAEAAIEPLSNAERISTDPELVCECIYLKAMCFMDLGQTSKGLPLANKLVSLSKTPSQRGLAVHLIGALLFDSGRITEARSHFAQAMALSPDHVHHGITYCATSAYGGDVDGLGQKALTLSHVAPIQIERAFGTAQLASQRIRLGFISGDFRLHSCAYFLRPLFAHIDQTRFELFAYDTGPQADAVTKQLQQHVQNWRQVSQLQAKNLAQTIAQDQLDVLVDLAGLTDGGRIEALSAQPARVQINWLGYLGTTGHPAIQYRLTDAHVDGPQQEGLATETPLRLNRPYVCYQAPDDAPEVAPLPMLANGYPTFGSFNALVKLSDQCVALWCQVLEAIPQARLLIKTKALVDEGTRQHTLSRFTDRGIAANRIELLAWANDTGGHLGLYRRIDVALDTTPYNGVTTTCEAMWMGVPVVSLAGDTYSSRQGLSLLHGVGLPELATSSEAAFVQRCVELSTQVDALAELRRTLRQRMQGSALTDGASFACAFEQAMEQAARHGS